MKSKTSIGKGGKTMKRHLVAWENGIGYTFKSIPGRWDFLQDGNIWRAIFVKRGEIYASMAGTGKTYKEALLNAQKIED